MQANSAAPVTLPKKLKAVIKFGYDEGLKDWLENFTDHWKREAWYFDEYIESLFTCTQVLWRHPSLTTEVIWEVKNIYIMINLSPSKRIQPFCIDSIVRVIL